MAKRGRPRKTSKVTYESKETKVVLGIAFFVLAILSFLSYFDDSSIVISTVRSFFGAATIFSAILFLNISLLLFDVKYPFSQSRSLLGQTVFVLGLIIVISLLSDPADFEERAKAGEVAGLVGFHVSRFLERQVLAQFTVVFGFLLVIISIPMILLMTFSEFISKTYEKIANYIAAVKARRAERLAQQEQEGEEKGAETFGDFSKKLDGFRNAEEQEEPSGVDTGAYSQGIGQGEASVSVKEKESSEGAMVSEELQYPNWVLPSAELLNNPPAKRKHREDIKGRSEVIEETLRSFNINAKVVGAEVGPTVTQYALDIPLGIKVSKISNLRNDIALALAAPANAVRIEAPIPGTSFVGIEIPNSEREAVYFKELVVSDEIKNEKFRLPVTVGKDIAGKNIITDIQKMPHLLVAGATGSGKSVLTNSFIMSFLMHKSPDEVRFIMVDPKQVELSDYNGIPHLLTPVITEMNKVNNALKWAISEMESRYTLFRENTVRNIQDYNQKRGFSALPYILIVIDEMADMMMSGGAEVEASIVRLAQKARATGIHLVLATQRPSVDVITGLIKANIPGRIGMSVATQIDSRVILDQIGAESLLGMGDMLFKEPDKSKPFRLQGVLITQDEVQRVVKFLKEQVDEVEYNTEVTETPPDPNRPAGADQSAKFSEDDLFADAVRVVAAAGKGSSSLIQRKLSIGYNRAARLLDELHKYGVVGPEKGSKPRDVLISDAEGFLGGGDQE
ncbi:DNA translocase FtsK [Candidatus Dojkabacteria bacterium]|nr:DNA translocase FtsK [Candidatus Dojkabacteria bacterium]